MDYSSKMQTYCQTYALRPREVAYALMLANGFNQAESYGTIFGSITQTAAASGAVRLKKEKPTILQAIDAMKAAARTTAKDRRKTETTTDNNEDEQITDNWKDDNESDNTAYRTKEEVITGLVKALRSCAPKDRAAVLMKIAELQRMKEESNAEEEQRVHYYLPIRCSGCSLYQAAAKQAKANEVASD